MDRRDILNAMVFCGLFSLSPLTKLFPQDLAVLQELTDLGYSEALLSNKVIDTGIIWKDLKLPKGYGRVTSVDLGKLVNSIQLVSSKGNTLIKGNFYLSYFGVNNFAGEFEVNIRKIPIAHSLIEGRMNSRINDVDNQHELILRTKAGFLLADYRESLPSEYDYRTRDFQENISLTTENRRKLGQVYNRVVATARPVLERTFKIEYR